MRTYLGINLLGNRFKASKPAHPRKLASVLGSSVSPTCGKRANLDARTTILGSSVFQFRLDYEQSKKRKYVHSDVVSAGGHLWRIEFFPCGESGEDNGEYISIFFSHMSKSRSVKAIFQSFVMDRDDKPSTSLNVGIGSETFKIMGDKDLGDYWGWSHFLGRAIVEENFVTKGHLTFLCAITVIDDSPIPVPPSDIGAHLVRLLDHSDGTDVSFIVDNETFPAHRAVLAARSPVFRAELFGSMAESTMSSIMLHDITPATFKVMLQFIYVDELPAEEELEDSSTGMFQNLLAAADRYALDRLKLICAQKLWDKVEIGTVAAILVCDETYNCHELKNKCIDFFVLEENFKEVVFTDGYASVLKFPLVVDELKKRIRAYSGTM